MLSIPTPLIGHRCLVDQRHLVRLRITGSHEFNILVPMNIEGDRTGLRLGAFQARLFGQKGRDGAIDHPQDRRKQLGLGGQQKT